MKADWFIEAGVWIFMWVAMIFLLAVAGCNFQCVKPGGPLDPPINPTDPITFAQVSSTILVPVCAKCHGGAGGYDFDTYDNVMKAVKPSDPANSVLCYVVKNGLMPPSGLPLTQNQVNLLCGWILQGAKP